MLGEREEREGRRGRKVGEEGRGMEGKWREERRKDRRELFKGCISMGGNVCVHTVLETQCCIYVLTDHDTQTQ